jgi:hypothetical protein
MSVLPPMQWLCILAILLGACEVQAKAVFAHFMVLLCHKLILLLSRFLEPSRILNDV